MILTKLSEPGWEKSYSDKFQLQAELYKCICSQCRCEEGITEISSIDDMLSTACGCEYMVEDEDPLGWVSDKGYQIGTQEGYEKFVEKRNQSWDDWKPNKDIV